jgi:hypothetical protein
MIASEPQNGSSFGVPKCSTLGTRQTTRIEIVFTFQGLHHTTEAVVRRTTSTMLKHLRLRSPVYACNIDTPEYPSLSSNSPFFVQSIIPDAHIPNKQQNPLLINTAALHIFHRRLWCIVNMKIPPRGLRNRPGCHKTRIDTRPARSFPHPHLLAHNSSDLGITVIRFWLIVRFHTEGVLTPQRLRIDGFRTRFLEDARRDLVSSQ